ncbi:MAG TPA: protein translocase subunit SecF [Alkalispirochaeta sp.]|nr:protein translocase subunit SecF [Alkalispirochaeta sp.]
MKRVYDFMKIRVVMLIISTLVIIGGIAGTIAQGGFNLGIDFEAGLSLTVGIEGAGSVESGDVRSTLDEYPGSTVQRVGPPEDNQFVIRIRDDGTRENFQQVVANDVLSVLREEFAPSSVEELETSYVGPRFSQDLTRQAILLTIFAMVLILAYLWFRFRLGYAVASISALAHDVLVMLGIIGTFQFEVSTATIAAVLTIIGYSLNDTIVIFDRVRENETLLRESPFRSIVNTSITQSLGRTLITSLTTLLAVAAIFVFATGQIQLFALKLMLGVVVGTYSSVFVASPVLLVWQTSEKARKKRKDVEKYHKGAAAGRGKEPTGDKAEAASQAAAAQTADIEAVKREVAQKRNKKKNRKSR